MRLFGFSDLASVNLCITGSTKVSSEALVSAIVEVETVAIPSTILHMGLLIGNGDNELLDKILLCTVVFKIQLSIQSPDSDIHFSGAIVSLTLVDAFLHFATEDTPTAHSSWPTT